MISFLFQLRIIWHFPFSNIPVIVFPLFSEIEADAHVMGGAEFVSCVSSPPGFFRSRFNTYSPPFLLSLLIKPFLVNFLCFPGLLRPSPPHFCFLHCCKIYCFISLASIFSWMYCSENLILQFSYQSTLNMLFP